MLTPYDDFPVHQTAEPVAVPASGDPNHYDRYFFNGYTGDGNVFFAAAMGHYPNRGVIDAAFSVVTAGIQRSVFASGLMPLDRSTAVGPIGVEVEEPLRRLRLVVAPNDFGLTADLVFDARTAAVAEPRTTAINGTRRTMDTTRLTQWGSWSGQLSVDGGLVSLGTDAVLGTRDRSWGQRGIGPQAPTNFPPALPQIFWLWAPLHFDDLCTHLALFEHADGHRWLEQGLVVPVLGAGQPTWGDTVVVEHLAGVDYDIEWQEGTRTAARASLELRHRTGTSDTIELEPLVTFRMRGIGYFHPVWGHGANHGTLEVGGESLVLSDVDPLDPTCIHVQTLCRARYADRLGVGVLEQLAFGDHAPSGLRGMVDGYRAGGAQ
jgi:hypothetical protein